MRLDRVSEEEQPLTASHQRGLSLADAFGLPTLPLTAIQSTSPDVSGYDRF
ncbi:MAG: hypothetical protein ACI87E_001565 [Mariniblastus sp.]|jgi:hypothetical protein